MPEDLSRCTPVQVEEARVEMVRAWETWKGLNFLVIEKALVEEHKSHVDHFADLHGEWSSHTEFLQREIDRHHAALRSFQQSIAACDRWRDPSSAVWMTIFGIFVSCFIGICAGLAAMPIVGLVIAVLLASLTVPSSFIWFSLRKKKMQTEVSYWLEEMNRVTAQLDKLESQLTNAKQQWTDIEQRWNDAYRHYQRLRFFYSLKDNVARTRQTYESLVSAAASCEGQLLHRNWRELRGIPFEDFLQEVFELLGYRVETTKKSGDHGIDHVLTGKGRTIGVQCKGHGGSVGNKAVQEAHTGKHIYNCDTCVVITNSDFTAAAKYAASRVGCLLICGDQIPDLIQGLIDLSEEKRGEKGEKTVWSAL